MARESDPNKERDQPVDDPEPDREMDPIGWQDWKLRGLDLKCRNLEVDTQYLHNLRRNLEGQVTSLRDWCSNFYNSYSENLKDLPRTNLSNAILETPVRLIDGVTTGNGLLVLIFSIAIVIAASYIGGTSSKKDYTFVASAQGAFVWRLNNQTGRVSICFPARVDQP